MLKINHLVENFEKLNPKISKKTKKSEMSIAQATSQTHQHCTFK